VGFLFADPPAGTCDDGIFVECCTTPEGVTECGLTVFKALAVSPAGRAWDWAFADEATPAEAYVKAREAGFKGSPSDFAAEWEAYQARKEAGPAGRARDDILDKVTPQGWDLGTVGLIGGALALGLFAGWVTTRRKRNG
jgi:hypothetical protein